ncbi:MAG: RNA polymerase sigma factor [Candidatus Eisenbacteria bacterium]|uniref:RNA polymerase sigma factor n=1 Tax=Eiseniibacteriota bacterium TaxID=2212470 RepID=A0A956LXA9_UNCEI|nr:RNA polymerase sigma factor [Candidatus Eisenbacteria bacterium]
MTARDESTPRPTRNTPRGTPAGGAQDLEKTAELLGRVRAGDPAAQNALVSRFLPLLQRWARGRLPHTARDLAETDDLVQVSFLRALRRIDSFEPRREGAFLAYLRRILLNAIREQYRQSATRGGAENRFAVDGRPESGPPALDARTLEAYESALERLEEHQREAVILRLEFKYSYAQIAEAINSPSEDAARMVVKRALVRLAGEMQSGPEAP